MPDVVGIGQKLRPFFHAMLERRLERLVRRGQITAEQAQQILAKHANTRDFREFFDYWLENWPEILEMFMAFVEAFIMIFGGL